MSSPSSVGPAFSLGSRARFLVSGVDASRYLNGQLSADVRKASASRAVAACLLNAKGKLVAQVFVWMQNDGYVIDANFDQRHDVAARLERYIIADDVTVTDLSTTTAGFHLVGEPTPENALSIARFGVPGWDTDVLSPEQALASEEACNVFRIRQGIPAWGRELNENTLVQEARLEEWTVDFDKGCYVGQEVVSRLKSVGRVNRRLHGFVGDLPDIQTARLLQVDGQAAGELSSVARDFELAQTVALGYVHRTFESATRFVVVDSEGQPAGELERRDFPI